MILTDGRPRKQSGEKSRDEEKNKKLKEFHVFFKEAAIFSRVALQKYSHPLEVIWCGCMCKKQNNEASIFELEG